MGSFYIIQSFRPQVNTRKKHEVIQNNHDFRKFYIKPLTPLPVLPYNTAMITTQLLLANEGYTHANWLFKNICTNFSRVYYILGGEGYCRYEGRTFRLKEHCLYFFPRAERSTCTTTPTTNFCIPMCISAPTLRSANSSN